MKFVVTKHTQESFHIVDADSAKSAIEAARNAKSNAYVENYAVREVSDFPKAPSRPATPA